jgi:hypothetical protein
VVIFHNQEQVEQEVKELLMQAMIMGMKIWVEMVQED